jgi:hypothetical protein
MSNAVIGALRVNLAADSAQFNKGMQNARRGMTGIEQAAKRMGAVLAGVFSAAALTRGLQGAVSAFASFEKQQLITQQVLQSTGFSAGRTAKQLEDLARQIGAATLASTQEVRDAANQLLTFRSIAGETFDRTLRAAQDLATVGFGSLSSTTQQLAKALEDPIQGLNSLRRAGVSFTDEQRRVIQGFIDTGNAAAAQNEILKTVEAQVGGAGGAAGGGLAGAYDTLTEEIKLFIERTGEQISTLSRLQDVIRGITSLFAADRVNTDPVEQALARIEKRTQNIADMREQMETGAGSRMLMQQQVDALEAANATDKMTVASARLRIGMEELNATRLSEIAQQQAQAERAAGVIQALDEERDAAGRTALENRILQEVRKAGVALDSDEARAIEERVRGIEAASAATKRLASGTSKSMSELATAAARVFDATRTPAERLNIEITELNRLVQAGAIDWDTYSRAVEQAQQKFKDASASGSNLASTLSGQFSSMFEGLITGTKSAGEAIKGLLQNLGKLLINKAFSALFGGMGGGGGFLSSLFGGFRANGGPVSGGKAYVVGERGPELFMPGMSGQVVSNENLQGGGGVEHVSVTVTLSDDLDAKITGTSQRVSAQAVKSYDKGLSGRISEINMRQG